MAVDIALYPTAVAKAALMRSDLTAGGRSFVVFLDELNGDLATSLLALVFDNGTLRAANRYELVLHLLSKRLELKFAGECSPSDAFDPSVAHDSPRLCGKLQLFVDSTTFDPLGASFEEGGFPRTFGKVRYLYFKFTEEFQKVSLGGIEEPLLLPAKVVVTYESDRGRTVIESKFSVESKSF